MSAENQSKDASNGDGFDDLILGALHADPGNRTSAGAVTLDNSTVSGNTANSDGGGIVSNGELITANATIADNRSNADGHGSGIGGGIFNGGLVTLKNTIVAGNHTGPAAGLNDLAGNNVRTSSLYNLISHAPSAGGLVDGVNGNIVGNGGVGFLPLLSILAPLAPNGGPTLTHALAAGSPALDKGNNTAAADIDGIPFPRDQRGLGFPRIKNGIVDIGALEN